MVGPTHPASALAILAGGLGARMGADGNKVFLEVGGRPVLAYSLETADRSSLVAQIVLVVREGEQAQAEQLVAATVKDTPCRLVVGGDTRHRSERNGVYATADLVEAGTIDVVAVHDGARPFQRLELLDQVLTTAHEVGGALPALATTELLYRPDTGTFLDPSEVFWAQTAQAFRAGTVLAAHRAAEASGFEGTDTVEVVEQMGGCSVAVVPGEPANLKVTFPRDLATASAVAATHGGQSGKAASQHALGTVRRSLAELTAAIEATPPGQPVVFQDEQEATSLPSTELVATMTAQLEAGRAAAVIAHSPASQAIKLVKDGMVRESIDRSLVYSVLPPEVIDREALTKAVASAASTRSSTSASDSAPLFNPSELIARHAGLVEIHRSTG